MAKKASKIRNAAGEVDKPQEAEKELARSDQLIGRKDVREAALEIYEDIEKGFIDQDERSTNNLDWWDCYNEVLNDNQVYQGNSVIYVPIVHNAVNARKVRFTNQLFPQNGRSVEAIGEDGEIPYREVALLEHYVKACKLRTRLAPALLKNGDVEGQYTIQVGWETRQRDVVQRIQATPEIGEGIQAPLEGEDEIDDIQEETLKEGCPFVKVIADSDLLVLPATADSIEEALASGGSVTTMCRWSKAKLQRMIAEDEIDEEEGKQLVEEMSSNEASQRSADKEKEMVDAAGIKRDGRGKFALVYRTWTMLTLKDDDGEDQRRLYLCYFAGKDRVLSVKRNPYWSDRIDILSAPVDKLQGSFKGQSLVKGVSTLQYQANDAVNEGMDSAAYALMPIILTDPEKNPKVGQMVLNLAAIWECDPASTKFAEFPHLWKDALDIVAACKQEVFQAMSVNPAQITQAQGGKAKKPNQAEIANEQQIDILTTSDAVTTLEDEIFSPMLVFMLELDHQYRTEKMRVREYGELGLRQKMMDIPPIRMNKLYSFRWFGVEQARSAQMMQQQVAGINVVTKIPPQLYKGARLDLKPVIAQMIENLFGPRLAPLVFVDQKQDLSVDPMLENQLLGDGILCPVHPLDNHQQHLQVHRQALQQGDPHKTVAVHMMAHMQALQMQMAASAPPGGPPAAGGGGGGGPKPGATPGAPRGGQRPAGMIHQDQLKDPAAVPRQ